MTMTSKLKLLLMGVKYSVKVLFMYQSPGKNCVCTVAEALTDYTTRHALVCVLPQYLFIFKARSSAVRGDADCDAQRGSRSDPAQANQGLYPYVFGKLAPQLSAKDKILTYLSAVQRK